MEQIILDKTIEYLAPVAATAIAGLVSWLLAAIGGYVRSKTRNEKIDNAIARVSAMTETTVAELSQTMAKELRKRSADGKLTPQDALELKEHAARLVKSRLTPEILSAAASGVSSLQALIIARIERAVGEQKGRRAEEPKSGRSETAGG